MWTLVIHDIEVFSYKIRQDVQDSSDGRKAEYMYKVIGLVWLATSDVLHQTEKRSDKIGILFLCIRRIIYICYIEMEDKVNLCS